MCLQEANEVQALKVRMTAAIDSLKAINAAQEKRLCAKLAEARLEFDVAGTWGACSSLRTK